MPGLCWRRRRHRRVALAEAKAAAGLRQAELREKVEKLVAERKAPARVRELPAGRGPAWLSFRSGQYPMATSSGPSKPSQGGFSLLEALIALVLLGVALLMGMELVLQNPRMVRRMDGERQAFRAMESTIESVRAGGDSSPVGRPRRLLHRRRHTGPARTSRSRCRSIPLHFPTLQVTLQARYTTGQPQGPEGASDDGLEPAQGAEMRRPAT